MKLPQIWQWWWCVCAVLVQVFASHSGCTLQAVWNILLGHKTAVWDVYTLYTERWRGFPRPCIWLTKQHQVKILSSWSPSPKVSGAMVRVSLELFPFAILCVRCWDSMQGCRRLECGSRSSEELLHSQATSQNGENAMIRYKLKK